VAGSKFMRKRVRSTCRTPSSIQQRISPPGCLHSQVVPSATPFSSVVTYNTTGCKSHQATSYPTTTPTAMQTRKSLFPTETSGSRKPHLSRDGPRGVGLTFPKHSLTVRFVRSGRFSWCLRHLRQRSATTTIAYQHPSRTRRQPRTTNKGLVNPRTTRLPCGSTVTALNVPSSKGTTTPTRPTERA